MKLILLLLVLIVVACMIIIFFYPANAFENMTAQENALLQLCMAYNLHNNDTCDQIYGNIGNESSVINRSPY